jgi:hypothetical protein
MADRDFAASAGMELLHVKQIRNIWNKDPSTTPFLTGLADSEGTQIVGNPPTGGGFLSHWGCGGGSINSVKRSNNPTSINSKTV